MTSWIQRSNSTISQSTMPCWSGYRGPVPSWWEVPSNGEDWAVMFCLTPFPSSFCGRSVQFSFFLNWLTPKVFHCPGTLRTLYMPTGSFQKSFLSEPRQQPRNTASKSWKRTSMATTLLEQPQVLVLFPSWWQETSKGVFGSNLMLAMIFQQNSQRWPTNSDTSTAGTWAMTAKGDGPIDEHSFSITRP